MWFQLSGGHMITSNSDTVGLSNPWVRGRINLLRSLSHQPPGWSESLSSSHMEAFWVYVHMLTDDCVIAFVMSMLVSSTALWERGTGASWSLMGGAGLDSPSPTGQRMVEN